MTCLSDTENGRRPTNASADGPRISHWTWPRKRERVKTSPLPFDKWDDFTIEAWVRDWEGYVFCQGKYGDPENGLFIFLDTAFLQGGWESGKGTNHTFSCLRGRFLAPTHVALVSHDGIQRLYVNGELRHESPCPAPGPLKMDSPLLLGAQLRKESMRRGSGLFQAFRVSSAALYHEDFEPPSIPSPSETTELLYDLSSAPGDGNAIRDLSGHGRHGTEWTLLGGAE